MASGTLFLAGRGDRVAQCNTHYKYGISPATMVKPIEISSEVVSGVGPMNHVSGGCAVAPSGKYG